MKSDIKRYRVKVEDRYFGDPKHTYTIAARDEEEAKEEACAMAWEENGLPFYTWLVTSCEEITSTHRSCL